ncbi:sugar phosphate isomerase/epimerase family protein [Cohnella suwonensis]|uniref:Sugar phosphate isomerase/epimerase family protein n=1 Tax=Cohnella suwonensis TaxID=696072 RepID=A0ABW0LU06_9BACL
MSYLSVSTWSLHRLLGPLRWTAWDSEAGAHRTNIQDQPQELTLLELPAEAARRGYGAVEICHFHFPSTNGDYLIELRDAFSDVGISFDTLLLDYGDLTTEDEARLSADMRLFREWIDVAARCGARKIRIVAGEASPDDEAAIGRSAVALSKLFAYAEPLGVKVVTENFKPLTSKGTNCLKLLEAARAGRWPLRMITDFGNFSGPSKYEELAMTLPYSLSVHAKAIFDGNGMPDEAEFRLCLDAVRDSGYEGSYVLVYDGPGNMWEGLERVRRIVEDYL